MLPDHGFSRAGELKRTAQHLRVGAHARKGCISRRQLQPDFRIFRELDRLERMPPGRPGLLVQIQAPGSSERALSDMDKLRADPGSAYFESGISRPITCSTGGSLQQKPSLKFNASVQS
jgi:hypothetical protein